VAVGGFREMALKTGLGGRMAMSPIWASRTVLDLIRAARTISRAKPDKVQNE